jgi:hypothetical protein
LFSSYFRSAASFELEIVNPARQPWVNIGRSFVKHPKGGATLDMDLSPVEFNRRISRLHATIRFNVLDRRWEVQVLLLLSFLSLLLSSK